MESVAPFPLLPQSYTLDLGSQEVRANEGGQKTAFKSVLLLPIRKIIILRRSHGRVSAA
jgi:hypothetical protein